MRVAVAGGVPVGDRVIVKAPFATDDGSVEWMWVKSLVAGARVEVEEAELYDYVYYRADGTELGGETNTILMKRSEESK